MRSFHDRADEQIGAPFAVELRLNIEVNRTPVPALRYDHCPAHAKIRIAGGVWKEHSQFGCNAGPGFVLQDSKQEQVFDEDSGIPQNR